MSETPRTDSFVREIISDLQSGTTQVVHADFARTLERELASVTKERDEFDRQVILNRENWRVKRQTNLSAPIHLTGDGGHAISVG